MQIIVFSYNRAMQLSALVNSILRWWRGGEYRIHIIYNTSQPIFESGYFLLRDRLITNTNIRFHKETPSRHTHWSAGELTDLYNLRLLYLCPFLRKKTSDFRTVLLRLLEASKEDCTMFLTDDSVFIREILWTDEQEDWLLHDGDHRQYSFRHGIELLPQEGVCDTPENECIWRFTDFKSSNHWGYLFSLDGHVYSTRSLYQLLRHASFSNPNTLESSGLLHSTKRGLFVYGRCLKNICLLSFPINLVQTTFPNKAMNAAPQRLNDLFLDGYSLEYPVIQEIDSFQYYPSDISLRKGKSSLIHLTL